MMGSGSGEGQVPKSAKSLDAGLWQAQVRRLGRIQ